MTSFVFIHSGKPLNSVLEIRRQVYCEEESRHESVVTDALLSREEHIFVQAERTKSPAGAVSFSVFRGDELKEIYNCSDFTDHDLVGVIAKLMLTRGYRGKPFLAVSLMFLAYEYLIRKNVKKIVIAVYASRRKVISMYERLGLTRLANSQGPQGKVLMYIGVETGYELALRKRCFSYISNQACIDIPYRLPLELEQV